MTRLVTTVLVLALLSACRIQDAGLDPGRPPADGAARDGGPDGAGPDAGRPDGRDAGGRDASASDAGDEDAGGRDAGAADAGRRDAGRPMGSGDVGEACADTRDCRPGLTCETSVPTDIGSVVLPGGYCTRTCTRGDLCGPGSICIDLRPLDGVDSGACAKTCTSGADCRTAEGYVCDNPFGMFSSAVCVPPIEF